MSTSTPTSQPTKALAAANEVKKRRSNLRKELGALPSAEARALLADAIASNPDWLGTQDVAAMLPWCPRLGKHAGERAMLAARIGARRELRRLSERQRTVLATTLREGPLR